MYGVPSQSIQPRRDMPDGLSRENIKNTYSNFLSRDYRMSNCTPTNAPFVTMRWLHLP